MIHAITDTHGLIWYLSEDPLLSRYVAYRYPRTSTIRRGVLSHDKEVLKEGRRVGKELVIYKGIEEKRRSRRLLTCND